MIKIVIFDTDGMVVRRNTRFSERFSKEFGVPVEKMLPFFDGEFRLCLVGKADLKEELGTYLPSWGWKKSVDDLLSYWFEGEGTVDGKVLESVRILRDKGIRCYINTNNERYRVEHLLNNFGLKDHFDGSFSSAELGVLKPQIEFWAAIWVRLGQPKKNEVLVFDDEEKNVVSAREFGFQAEVYSGFDVYEESVESLAG